MIVLSVYEKRADEEQHKCEHFKSGFAMNKD